MGADPFFGAVCVSTYGYLLTKRLKREKYC